MPDAKSSSNPWTAAEDNKLLQFVADHHATLEQIRSGDFKLETSRLWRGFIEAGLGQRTESAYVKRATRHLKPCLLSGALALPQSRRAVPLVVPEEKYLWSASEDSKLLQCLADMGSSAENDFKVPAQFDAAWAEAKASMASERTAVALCSHANKLIRPKLMNGTLTLPTPLPSAAPPRPPKRTAAAALSPAASPAKRPRTTL